MPILIPLAFWAMNALIFSCVIYHVSSPLIQHGVHLFQASLEFVRPPKLLAASSRPFLLGAPELEDQVIPFGEPQPSSIAPPADSSFTAFAFCVFRFSAVVSMLAWLLHTVASILLNKVVAILATSRWAVLRIASKRQHALLYRVGVLFSVGAFARVVALAMVDELQPPVSFRISPLFLLVGENPSLRKDHPL
jgi:hypothetical protein